MEAGPVSRLITSPLRHLEVGSPRRAANCDKRAEKSFLCSVLKREGSEQRTKKFCKSIKPVRNRGYEAGTNQFGKITTGFYANIGETEALLRAKSKRILTTLIYSILSVVK